jgi:hypothetical protein
MKHKKKHLEDEEDNFKEGNRTRRYLMKGKERRNNKNPRKAGDKKKVKFKDLAPKEY